MCVPRSPVSITIGAFGPTNITITAHPPVGRAGPHIEHVYDFYKPRSDSEYPVVDGQLSIQSYLKALDFAYDAYRKRFSEIKGEKFSSKQADYFVFHSPYGGMVKKAVARLTLNDFLENPENPEFAEVKKYKNQQREETYFNKGLNSDFDKLSVALYKEKVHPSTLLPSELGNSYCASVYTGLLSLIDAKGDELVGKRVCIFSYGSGMAATLFSLQITGPVQEIKNKAQIVKRLQQRNFVDPKIFTHMLSLREKRVTGHSYVPEGPINDLFPGTFYLEKVDDKYRRYYKRLPSGKGFGTSSAKL